jgi:Ca-activated chloride channel family protein
MRFEHPQFLWLLLVVPPVLALFFWWGSRMRQRLLSRFVESRLLGSLTVGLSPARRNLRFGLILAAAGLLIVTIAQPQRGFDLEQVEQRGLDIVVAVDTSKSMLATDIAPNRLGRAKLAALELMQKAATDRLGLEAFAGEAFMECPLTIDDTAFGESVQALNVNSIPEGGTAIRAAIETALAAFKERDHYKALVLLTDGEDNDEGALEEAQAAAKEGLKIFTVGIGSAEGTLVTVKDANGNSDYIRDEKGQVVKSRLNEPFLKEIAESTGGFYLPLRGANTMDVLYNNGLSQLPKTDEKARVMRRYHEQYRWPLLLAMALLVAEMLFPERKSPRRRMDGRPPESRAPGATAPARVAALLMGCLLLPALARASTDTGAGLPPVSHAPDAPAATPAEAMRDYRSGHFTNALAAFTALAEVRTNDLRVVFDAGDAAYRATNFDLAQGFFSQAALSPDLKLQQQAFYNLGNAQFQKAKLAQDLDGLQDGLEAAEKTYSRAVTLNTNDADALFNLNFTKNAVEQIKLFKEAMRRAKTEADAAVRQAQFHRALEIMAPLQKTIAAKQFEDFTKKLKQIDDIANPHQP